MVERSHSVHKFGNISHSFSADLYPPFTLTLLSRARCCCCIWRTQLCETFFNSSMCTHSQACNPTISRYPASEIAVCRAISFYTHLPLLPRWRMKLHNLFLLPSIASTFRSLVVVTVSALAVERIASCRTDFSVHTGSFRKRPHSA